MSSVNDIAMLCHVSSIWFYARVPYTMPVNLLLVETNALHLDCYDTWNPFYMPLIMLFLRPSSYHAISSSSAISLVIPIGMAVNSLQEMRSSLSIPQGFLWIASSFIAFPHDSLMISIGTVFHLVIYFKWIPMNTSFLIWLALSRNTQDTLNRYLLSCSWNMILSSDIYSKLLWNV